MKKIFSIVMTLVLLFSLCSFALAGDVNYVAPPQKGTAAKLVAHRGLSCAAPENTLAAFELAGKTGYTGIEFDIYPTTDGKWVVMHDETVDRMTDKTGKITEMTYAQTQECTIDAGNGIAEYPGQKIPTLEQVLAICEKYNATPFIEIKGGTTADVNQLAQLISEYKNHNKFVFISFGENYICQIKALLPEVTVLWLVSKPNEANIAYCLENNIDGIDFNYKNASDRMIRKIVSSGLISGAWTVDSPDDFSSLCLLNVEYVTTNCIFVKEKENENVCTHICHSDNPLLKFIWKVISFFINLTGEKYCVCGQRH